MSIPLLKEHIWTTPCHNCLYAALFINSSLILLFFQPNTNYFFSNLALSNVCGFVHLIPDWEIPLKQTHTNTLTVVLSSTLYLHHPTQTHTLHSRRLEDTDHLQLLIYTPLQFINNGTLGRSSVKLHFIVWRKQESLVGLLSPVINNNWNRGILGV